MNIKSPPHVIELAIQLYDARLKASQKALTRDEDVQLLALCMSDAQSILAATQEEATKH